jgi:hypothetical protein
MRLFFEKLSESNSDPSSVGFHDPMASHGGYGRKMQERDISLCTFAYHMHINHTKFFMLLK